AEAGRKSKSRLKRKAVSDGSCALQLNEAGDLFDNPLPGSDQQHDATDPDAQLEPQADLDEDAEDDEEDDEKAKKRAARQLVKEMSDRISYDSVAVLRVPVDIRQHKLQQRTILQRDYRWRSRALQSMDEPEPPRSCFLSDRNRGEVLDVNG
ncbi:unnamed protein product, partial [Amoebophrya sp. A25]